MLFTITIIWVNLSFKASNIKNDIVASSIWYVYKYVNNANSGSSLKVIYHYHITLILLHQQNIYANQIPLVFYSSNQGILSNYYIHFIWRKLSKFSHSDWNFVVIQIVFTLIYWLHIAHSYILLIATFFRHKMKPHLKNFMLLHNNNDNTKTQKQLYERIYKCFLSINVFLYFELFLLIISTITQNCNCIYT